MLISPFEVLSVSGIAQEGSDILQTDLIFCNFLKVRLG